MTMIKNSEAINFLSYTARKKGNPNVFISVGIPGSGKTTFMSEMASHLNIRRISPDEIREELTGDITDQSRNSEVWEIAHDRVREELEAERSVILDATHYQSELRRESATKFKAWGAKALIAVIFDIPLQVAKDRNDNRERNVPEFVIDRMYDALKQTPPSFDEGIDVLFTSLMAKEKAYSDIDQIHAEIEID